MKYFIPLLLILFTSCVKKSPLSSVPEKVTITGTVKNFNPDRMKVKFYVNTVSFGQENITAKLDENGHFKTSFETYIPTDLWIHYNTNVLVAIHPGDSINVVFEGKARRRPEILETIEFGGDAKKFNEEIALFQKMYFSNKIYTNRRSHYAAAQKLSPTKYLSYIDSLNVEGKNLIADWNKEYSPSEKSKQWAKAYLQGEYFYKLFTYEFSYSRKPGVENIPLSYFNTVKDRKTLSEAELSEGYTLSSYVNFYNSYVHKKVLSKPENKRFLNDKGGFKPAAKGLDSLFVYSIVNTIDDGLLRQMVLSEYLYQMLKSMDVHYYEKFETVRKKYITEPFLFEPLAEKYQKVKAIIENPKVSSEATLNKLATTDAGALMDSILSRNKNKVVYIDCWATWCGPCKGEMPRSKELMKELKEEDVTFVFLCLESSERNWKQTLADLQIGGEHYLLDENQSNGLREGFGIQGIPFYLLINKDGVIVDKGSHLRPGGARKKIKDLL